MADVDRIRALQASGHLSDAEAERLIDLLAELDADVAPEPARVRPAAALPPAPPSPVPAAPATPPVRAVHPTPPAPPAPPQPTDPTDPDDLDLAPAATRWCELDLVAGDLHVAAGDVDEPRLEGPRIDAFEIERRDDGWRIRGPRLRGLLGAWRSHRGDATDLTLTLPRDWALALTLKAGDAEIRGVRWVRARQMAGDLEVEGAHALDLSLGVGDLDVAATLTDGHHRVRAKVGDVTLRLLPGSDARVRASLALGDLDAPDLRRDDRLLGGRGSAICGSGRADVDVSLGTGDLKIRLPDGAGR